MLLFNQYWKLSSRWEERAEGISKSHKNALQVTDFHIHIARRESVKHSDCIYTDAWIERQQAD